MFGRLPTESIEQMVFAIVFWWFIWFALRRTVSFPIGWYSSYQWSTVYDILGNGIEYERYGSRFGDTTTRNIRFSRHQKRAMLERNFEISGNCTR
jgi:hypothetical protein